MFKGWGDGGIAAELRHCRDGPERELRYGKKVVSFGFAREAPAPIPAVLRGRMSCRVSWGRASDRSAACPLSLRAGSVPFGSRLNVVWWLGGASGRVEEVAEGVVGEVEAEDEAPGGEEEAEDGFGSGPRP